jgi:4-hydroxybenzoate polyprenyltransferase
MSAETAGDNSPYGQLMRLNRPIGALLLLWPTLWGLWLAARGMPKWHLILIFTAGVFVMRAAGCVINDYADRNIDGHVERTRNRPLATGAISDKKALTLFIILVAVAFALVLMTNKLTIELSVGALILAIIYPFMKRYTHMPQIVLGAAFAWSVPMAYTAQTGELSPDIWLVYVTVVIWTVVYDTFYAMVDRNDDIKIGVKSTAILFGELDRAITAFLQLLVILCLVMVGTKFKLGVFYYVGIGAASLLFLYQQVLIRNRQREDCFKAFLNNNWVGVVVFIGIVTDFMLASPVE